MSAFARVRRCTAVVAVLGMLVAACSGGSNGSPDDETDSELVAVPASFDVAVGSSGRFLVGLFSRDKGDIGYGEVEFRFYYLGNDATSDGSPPAATAKAQFLPIPGSNEPPPGRGPSLLESSQDRGVYAADVGFDRPGFWQVEVTADIDGVGRQSATAAFDVLAGHQVPAVGEPAIPSRNLVMTTPDAAPQSIDSRASDADPVPDPSLHATTIADSVAAGRPAVVVFATPTFCISRFCGPVTDMVAELAADYADRASFIHVEIWKDFEARVLNETAAEWLTRNGADGNEPWVFLIGADGRIAARWDNVATRGEIEPLLQALPAIGR